MLILAFTSMLMTSSAAQATQTTDVALARATVERLAKGEFAAVHATFSKKLQRALPEDKLRSTWRRVESKAGRLKNIGEPQFKNRRELRGVVLPTEFEKRKIKIEVVFNAAGEIAGLLFD